MGLLAPKTGATGASTPVLTQLANEDKTPWYRKPNLRLLYLLLFPACMCIEATSGFDSQMMNALQIVPAWQKCEYRNANTWTKFDRLQFSESLLHQLKASL